MSSSLRDDLHFNPGMTRRDLLAAAAAALATAGVPRVAGAAAPQGQLTWGVHISLAPTWFDPAERRQPRRVVVGLAERAGL